MVPMDAMARSTGFCLALLLAVLGSGGSRTAVAADAPRSGSSDPEIALHQVHMVETRDGSTVWEVRADRVEVSERGGATVLSRETRPVEIVFFSTRGRVTCTADRAVVDLKTKDVELSGAVIARSDQGMELRTEALKWIAASRRLQSNRAVTITRGTLVSQGKGMEAEADLERVRLFQNITSQFGPASAPTGRSRPR
jgi:LPS export ABC transporter protein LptC